MINYDAEILLCHCLTPDPPNSEQIEGLGRISAVLGTLGRPTSQGGGGGEGGEGGGRRHRALVHVGEAGPVLVGGRAELGQGGV